MELRQNLRDPHQVEPLKTIATILRKKFDDYSWVGIYFVKGENLVLAAYAGQEETEHTTIPIGEGVCGYAAKTGKTEVVPDVSKDPRYLMCFPSTRSEIVVPITFKNRVIGEIDIDSDRLSAFSADDEMLLNGAANELADYLESTGNLD